MPLSSKSGLDTQNEEGDIWSDSKDDSESKSNNTVLLDGFSKERINQVFNNIKEVVVPQGITRVAGNLGATKGGKLKASKWKVLFSIYLPLAFLNVALDNSDQNTNTTLVENFVALVVCTIILESKSVKIEDRTTLQNEYQIYTNTSKRLWPKASITPNHHYALHLPEQLKWWGPLTGVSEFGGERMNGLLQRIKTNGLAHEMGKTILTKFCQVQRLVVRHGM